MSTTAEAAPAPVPTPDPAAEQALRLYRYSTWLHLGPEAENCEAVTEGESECSNPLHFHAWCRLPNQFQHRDIREKAFAAKARRVRQLRNEGTDAYEILEQELDILLRGGEATKEQLVEELVAKDWWQDYLEAATEVRKGDDDADDDPPFAHIDDDQQRFAQLQETPDEERPADEYVELESHLTAYGDAVEEQLKRITEPKRTALQAKDLPELVDMVRDQRIEGMASDEFMHVYAAQSWLVGTLRKPEGEPRFASMEALQSAAPEVITALKVTFEDLENSQSQKGVVQGNS